jgi:hypothetical protein
MRKIFLFSLIFLPYINLFYFIFQNNNSNNISLLLFYVILFGYFSFGFLKNNVRYLSITYLLFLIGIIVIISRIVIYNETIDLINNNKFYFLFLIYIFTSNLITKQIDKTTLINMILYNSLFQAFFGILHYYFLYQFSFFSNFYFPGEIIFGLRESGLLINANLFSSFIFLGLIILIRDEFKKYIHINRIIKSIFFILIIYALFLSGSRIVFLLLAILILSILKKRKSLKTIISLVSFIAMLSLIRMDLFIATFNRLINLDFSRLLSFYTTINMLFSSFESIIIGVPNIKVLNTYTSLNTVVSDNSFGLYLLSYGLIFTFFYLIVVVILLNKFKISLFYWIYFLVILLFNNAILWDVWILYFLTLINTINDLKKGDTYNENKEIFNFSNRRWETNKEKIYSLRHSLY